MKTTTFHDHRRSKVNRSRFSVGVLARGLGCRSPSTAARTNPRFLFVGYLVIAFFPFPHLFKCFCMKTHNYHPLWYNQPLRLNEEQTNNPKLILDDFFECYHLNDVREIMWQWLTAVISCPCSNPNDHHERSNNMYFYEQMESLVEAAWIINRSTGKVPNPDRQVLPEKEINEGKDTTVKVDQADRFSKPARLIEKVTTEPAAVIVEVFSGVTFNDLHEYLLPTWLRVAVINTQSPYSAGNGRETLYEFYEQLLSFVEALYVTSEITQENRSTYSITDQAVAPTPGINQFFQQFSIDYVRRELCDFLEAGIGYEGNYPNGFTPWQAWMTYNHLQCLIEAAYQLYINQQMAPVQNALAKVYN
ncbi:MAG TPA: hypothetical protein VF008_30825 [Niastella sp.]